MAIAGPVGTPLVLKAGVKTSVDNLVILFFLLVLSSPSGRADAPARMSSLTGGVFDTEGRPVIGATVTLLQDTTIASVAVTDSVGGFTIDSPKSNRHDLRLRLSAVGYETAVFDLDGFKDIPGPEFILQAAIIDVGSIEVTAVDEGRGSEMTLSETQVARRAQRSVVPTNPISAIRQPQVSREGSAHSSKLRVNGTNPDYFINGINIGADPSHYGVFSIIPSSVVDRLRFNPQGNDASFSLPATVELFTPARFEKHRTGEVNVSLVEATGSLSVGTDRVYSVGSVRKSVLDKLVNYFDVSSDRRTLPPTNFEDIFLSSGLRLTDHARLFFDQYHVRDFLSYQTESSVYNAGGISVFEHCDEHYYGLRLDAVYRRALIRFNSSLDLATETYNANPGVSLAADLSGITLELSEAARTYSSGVAVSLIGDNSQLDIGDQFQYVALRDWSLRQRNWNFRPADAASDNPAIYQAALNEVYAETSGDDTEINNAAYVSYSHHWARLKIRTGLRLEYFGNLRRSTVPTFRTDFEFNLGEGGSVTIHAGTYAENPAGNILDSYQVPVRANLSKLSPVETGLLSVGYRRGAFSFSVFGKRVSGLPVLTPDFGKVDCSGEAPVISDDFLAMKSGGETRFAGGDITFEMDRIKSTGISLYGFYGYTYAVNEVAGISTPYELNAPHKLLLQADYEFSALVTVGAELGVRSGYRFTPGETSAPKVEDLYTGEYYADRLASENSESFDINASFDLHAILNFGDSELYLNVANVTNNSNPIINTADGYIYDAGILPSIGYRLRF